MGRLEVKVAFELNGRGYVVAGNVLEGTLKVGQHIKYKDDSRCYDFNIESLEMLDIDREAQIAYPALIVDIKEVKAAGLNSENKWVGRILECTQ